MANMINCHRGSQSLHCRCPRSERNRAFPRRDGGDALRSGSTGPRHGARAEMCGLCQHPLEDNAHGPDQNDFEMNGDKLKHFGTCTYCKYCNGAAQSAAVAAVRAESKQREKEAYKRGWNRGFKALLLRLP